MSLTLGSGPFGQRPGGVFNRSPDGAGHVLYFEDSPRRIRGLLAGETVVDSRRVKLLHETGLLPVFYFPAGDVRADLLEPSRHSTHCPFKGDASYWSVRVGDRLAENAVWSYEEPIPGAPPLAGYLAFYWKSLDRWLEEDEELFGHARDPYHRLDVRSTSRAVRISVHGEVVAETSRARVLFETGLPPRWYVVPEDVHTDLLVPSEKTTVCAYKGRASYWSLALAGDVEQDLVWSYPEPAPEVAGIARLLCFFNERVELELDGELQPRPLTQWS